MQVNGQVSPNNYSQGKEEKVNKKIKFKCDHYEWTDNDITELLPKIGRAHV